MYIDADVLYALIKPSDWLKKHAKKIVGERLSTSAITITELELVSKRDFGDEFSLSVAEKIFAVKNLEVLPLTKGLVLHAAGLRKKHHLGIFDSLHAATALQHKSLILSSDQMFDAVEGLERKDPREL